MTSNSHSSFGNESAPLPRPARGSWEPPPWDGGGQRRPDGQGPLPSRLPLKLNEDPPRGAPAVPTPTQRAPTQVPPATQQPAPTQPRPQTQQQPREPSPPQHPQHQQEQQLQQEQQQPAPTADSYEQVQQSLSTLDVALTAASASNAQPRAAETPSENAESNRIATMSPRHKVEAWLAVMVKSGASDLILRAGGRPSTRIDGRIGFLPGKVPGAGPLLEVLEGVMGEDRMQIWRRTGSVDAALQLDGLGRFRLNAYKQMGEPAVVVRRISDLAPQLDKLELPVQELVKIAMRKRGLVLVTGIAGSGKSTTLAAMIEYMNQNAERHVITLEDPIEVLFGEKRCVISQREVGIDCDSFAEGLRHALRQSPDVIQIGEMRDKETVAAALDAAETGHLVMSTLHTVNAAQTIDRVLGFFPAEQHTQVRTRLSDNLACVLSQRLVPRASGKGMVPAFELLTQNPRVRELIEKGETGELMRTVEQGATAGLISFNQSLRRLVQQKLVDLKDALAASDRPDELVLALRGITSSSGRGRGDSGPGS